MKSKMNLVIYIAVGLLLAALSLDVLAHRNVIVKAAGGPLNERAKHYSNAKRTPFTFVSRYTITDASLTQPMLSEVTIAEDSLGRRFRSDKSVNSFSDKEVIDQSDILIEPPDGKFTVLFSTKWQQALHKPTLATTGTNPRTLLVHPRSEENCTPPEHSQSLLRNETLTIGGQDYDVAVVQTVSGNEFVKTSWRAMKPELGCLELKSIAENNSPIGGRGKTVQEPVSLSLGDPDPQLIDLPSRINQTATESVPFDKWKSFSKYRTDEYKSEYQRIVGVRE